MVITIEDTGLGIDPVDIPHIFDKFYRSRSVDGHISGTGIGLYIVKTLVNAMRGEIEVESTLGKGGEMAKNVLILLLVMLPISVRWNTIKGIGYKLTLFLSFRT